MSNEEKKSESMALPETEFHLNQRVVLRNAMCAGIVTGLCFDSDGWSYRFRQVQSDSAGLAEVKTVWLFAHEIEALQ